MFLLNRLFGRDRARGPATADVRRSGGGDALRAGADEGCRCTRSRRCPESSTVSVTCSPAKGIPATLELTTAAARPRSSSDPAHLGAAGRGPDARVKLAAWIREHGLREVFVIGRRRRAAATVRTTARSRSSATCSPHDPGSSGSASPAIPTAMRSSIGRCCATRCTPSGAARRGRRRSPGLRRRCASTPVASVSGSRRNVRSASRCRSISACPASSTGRG